ncbi:MAG: tetratricopeptide repeat protein [Bacteroidales bacterium]
MTKGEKNSAQHAINKAIRKILVAIYAFLIIFGVVSLFSPEWLKGISHVGRKSEATLMQSYGDHFLNQQEFEKAVVQYDRAIQINPGMAEAYINKGVALRHMKLNEEAAKTLEKALEFEEAQHDVTYFTLAEIFYVQNKPDKAVEYFMKSASVAPFPLPAYQRAGEILNNTAQWDAARETFRLAMEHQYTMRNCYEGMLKRDYYLTPNQESKAKIKALLETGIEEADLSHYDEQIFNEALKRDPIMAGIYNQLGYTHAMTGNLEDAIKYFSLAVEMAPDFENARKNLNAALHMARSQNSTPTL